ncbi:lysozyme [Methylobacterium brachiatum]|uniref:lysozyme n=1 Tax=Methylobacterium brachiatum TaxID=269660 RepID=UPI00244AAD1D|nr:lysozyme [Methylobacterium brachiatum]MDH2313171.1 lysozyme [Methylobacterium brachiatum]
MLGSLFRRPAAAVRALPAGAKGRLVAGSALAALACTTITGFEGMRTNAYRDSVGIPTICVGETKHVRMGMTIQKPQCEAMLLKRLSEDFAPAMERCAKQPMGDDQYAANLSLIYNIGEGAYCKSTVVRRWNAGDRRGSCHAFLKFDRAGGRVLAGLVKRRKAEEALCLKGI